MLGSLQSLLSQVPDSMKEATRKMLLGTHHQENLDVYGLALTTTVFLLCLPAWLPKWQADI